MSRKSQLLSEAISNNELSEFIMGSNKKYYLSCQYADMPTDPDQVFDSFKEYYQLTNDESIWVSFENEIANLNKVSDGAWFSIYYLSMYLSYRKYTEKEFINLETTIKVIENGLNKFKTELKKNRKWVGNDFENGLWGDVVRLVNILNNKFDINIGIM
ncbi:MAG: hypothetical protein WBM13_04250 [Bacteroidia bacterium]